MGNEICSWQTFFKNDFYCGSKLVRGHEIKCPYGADNITGIKKKGDKEYRLGVQIKLCPGTDGICENFYILSDVKEKVIVDFVKNIRSYNSTANRIVNELRKTESSLVSMFR